jgi:mRNA-degrading endonuclease RelE of RelBE toxin-antitoxin system
MDSTLADPSHSYKFLGHDIKSINQVHLGHFVLVFIINHVNKKISFEDYDHQDNIYKD